MLPPASGCRHAPLRCHSETSACFSGFRCLAAALPPSLRSSDITAGHFSHPQGKRMHGVRLTALAPPTTPKWRCDAGPLCSGKWRRPLHSLRAACGPRRGGDGSKPLKPQARFRVRLSLRCTPRHPSALFAPSSLHSFAAVSLHSAPCIITALCLRKHSQVSREVRCRVWQIRELDFHAHGSHSTARCI